MVILREETWAGLKPNIISQVELSESQLKQIRL